MSTRWPQILQGEIRGFVSMYQHMVIEVNGYRMHMMVALKIKFLRSRLQNLCLNSPFNLLINQLQLLPLLLKPLSCQHIAGLQSILKQIFQIYAHANYKDTDATGLQIGRGAMGHIHSSISTRMNTTSKHRASTNHVEPHTIRCQHALERSMQIGPCTQKVCKSGYRHKREALAVFHNYYHHRPLKKQRWQLPVLIEKALS